MRRSTIVMYCVALLAWGCGGGSDGDDGKNCWNAVLNCQVGCAQTEAACLQTAWEHKNNCTTTKCVKSSKQKEEECGEEGEKCENSCKSLCDSKPLSPSASCSLGCSGCCSTDGACMGGHKDESCGSGGNLCLGCPSGYECIGKTCQPTGNCDDGHCFAVCVETCDGCCDDSGTCLTDSSSSSCGFGGVECAVCAEGELCQDGICQDACPLECSGCCDEFRKCQDGSSDSTCGQGGGDCEVCSGTQTCKYGTCKACSVWCDDCCTDEGECMSGDTEDFCGLEGGACTKCQATFKCMDGECESCKKWCTGCCQDGECFPGNTQERCGSDGHTCETCDHWDGCEDHECLDCSEYCGEGCCTKDGACHSGTTDKYCAEAGFGHSCWDCKDTDEWGVGYGCEPENNYCHEKKDLWVADFLLAHPESNGKVGVCINKNLSGSGYDGGHFIKVQNTGYEEVGSFVVGWGLVEGTPPDDIWAIHWCPDLKVDQLDGGWEMTWEAPYCCIIDTSDWAFPDLYMKKYRLYVVADKYDAIDESEEDDNLGWSDEFYL